MKNRVLAYIVVILVFAISCSKNDPVVDDQLFLRFEGADMPIWVKGYQPSKTIVVIVHGGPGASAMDYRMTQFAKDMEERYLVAYWDQRGSGTSQGKFSNKLYTIGQFTEDLKKVIDLIKNKYGEDNSIFLYGHSWGGLLGSAFLINENYQAEITGWIESDGAHNMPMLLKLETKMLIDIGSYEIEQGNNTDKWTEIVDYCSQIDTANITMEQSVAMNKYSFEAEGLLEDVNVPSTGSVGEMFNFFFFSQYNPMASFFTNRMTNYHLSDEVEVAALSSQLYKIKIPTLVMYGRYDFVTPPGLADDAMENLGASYKHKVIFQHSGHSPMMNEPEEYSFEVINFIEQFR